MSQWKSIEEHTPPVLTEVLVLWMGLPAVAMVRFSPRKGDPIPWNRADDPEPTMMVGVTHWMPIPEKPSRSDFSEKWSQRIADATVDNWESEEVEEYAKTMLGHELENGEGDEGLSYNWLMGDRESFCETAVAMFAAFRNPSPCGVNMTLKALIKEAG